MLRHGVVYGGKKLREVGDCQFLLARGLQNNDSENDRQDSGSAEAGLGSAILIESIATNGCGTRGAIGGGVRGVAGGGSSGHGGVTRGRRASNVGDGIRGSGTDIGGNRLGLRCSCNCSVFLPLRISVTRWDWEWATGPGGGCGWVWATGP